MKHDPKDILWKGQPLEEVEAPELRKAFLYLLSENDRLRDTQRSPIERLYDLRTPEPTVPPPAAGNPNRWTSTDTLIFSCGLFCGVVGLTIVARVLGW